MTAGLAADARAASRDWWHWLLLFICVAIQAALVLGYLIGLAFLQHTEAWLEVPGRLTIGFAVASGVAAVGLLHGRRWARFAAMLTPAQLVWPVVLAAGEEPLGAAIVVGAAALNVILLSLIGPLFGVGRPGWWDVGAACICVVAFGVALIDPGPHPPTERLEPAGLAMWRAPSADGEVILADKGPVSVDEIRLIPDGGRIEHLRPGYAVLYGRDATGKTWVVQLSTTDRDEGCLRLRGPAFQVDGHLLVSPSTNEIEPSEAGILLPIAPVDATEAEELARPRLIGSYCLDGRGRVRSHDPPVSFGY